MIGGVRYPDPVVNKPQAKIKSLPEAEAIAQEEEVLHRQQKLGKRPKEQEQESTAYRRSNNLMTVFVSLFVLLSTTVFLFGQPGREETIFLSGSKPVN
jgi:hypothetical protein